MSDGWDPVHTVSPIERDMNHALIERTMIRGAVVVIDTQVRIGPFRVDLYVCGPIGRTWHDGPWPKSPRSEASVGHMVVECDGHEWHERTKEQAKSDKQRDRQLQAHGYVVFRFTGSEIYEDPDACADVCLDYFKVRPSKVHRPKWCTAHGELQKTARILIETGQA